MEKAKLEKGVEDVPGASDKARGTVKERRGSRGTDKRSLKPGSQGIPLDASVREGGSAEAEAVVETEPTVAPAPAEPTLTPDQRLERLEKAMIGVVAVLEKSGLVQGVVTQQAMQRSAPQQGAPASEGEGLGDLIKLGKEILGSEASPLEKLGMMALQKAMDRGDVIDKAMANFFIQKGLLSKEDVEKVTSEKSQ